jgi:hypothetical protein
MLLIAFAGVLLSGSATADEILLQPEAGRFVATLYTRVVEGTFDPTPFYEAFGIQVSNSVCDRNLPDGSLGSCVPGPCPLGKELGLEISCLYPKGHSPEQADLLVDGRPPVRTLRDYESSWNTYQFQVLERKIGRLPLVGVLRTLSVPGQERSGFFEYRRIEETLDGTSVVEKWKRAVRIPCKTVFCFSIDRLKLPAELNGSGITSIFAECVRRMIGDTSGPPQYCTPIYMEGQKGTYVAAITSFRNEKMRVGAGMISARIFFSSSKGLPSTDRISEVLENAFGLPPLSFRTSRDPDAVVGVCAKRASNILQNWYEMATVRAVVTALPLSWREPGKGVQQINGVQVGFATTLYVDNRNTLDDSEWRMPSRDQNEMFDTAVVSAVKVQAQKLCADASSKIRDGIMVITCPSKMW